MDRYDYQALVNEVVTRGINMFESFDDWTKGAFALSNLGEDGRSMFKSITIGSLPMRSTLIIRWALHHLFTCAANMV